MKAEYKGYARTGFFLSALGIILTTIIFTALPTQIKAHEVLILNSGAISLILNGLVISFIAINHRKFNDKFLVYPLWALILGVLTFTISIIVYGILGFLGEEEEYSSIKTIASIGGILQVIGWVWISFNNFTNSENSSTESASKSKHKHHKHRSSSSKHRSMADLAKQERSEIEIDAYEDDTESRTN